MTKDVILTGLRTNAEYHLGNYLGAILPMVELQKKYIGKYQVNMFAPDLHSFTTEVDHNQLYRQTHDNLKMFIAAGLPIDHPDFFLYRQSYIPAHSELTVILNNFAHFGELSRMTQFKEKSDEIKQKSVSAGLFDYPVLMAADIVLYGARWVPVGDDQQQHLEFARDLAQRFNNKFGDILVVPQPIDKQLEFVSHSEGVRIRSLRTPARKMSKSIDDPAGTILLSDTPKSAMEKINSATTDNENRIAWDWGKQAGVTNLLQIYGLLESKSQKDVLSVWAGRSNYGELKQAVAEAVAKFLSNIQAKLRDVSDEKLERKLRESEVAMGRIANETLLKVQKAVGLRV